MTTSGYWQDLTTQDFGDLGRCIALLPVAAIEQHGPHLPLSTDAVINAGIVARSLELLGDEPVVLVLPPQDIGHSLEHTSFAGTLSADAETLLALWSDIARGAAAAGIGKLVILNSHGGQKSMVDLVAIRLRSQLGLRIVRANYFDFGMPPGLFDDNEIAHGLHGGQVETSLMLHLAPELVRQDRLRDFESRSAELAMTNQQLGIEKPVGIAWMSEDLNPAGVCGNAASADADLGRRYLEHLAASLVTLLTEFAAI